MKRILKSKLNKKKKRQDIYSFSFSAKLRYFYYGAIFSFLFIFLPMIILIFLQDLPSPKELTFRQVPQTTKIYDRNGILITDIYSVQNRTLISLSDVPLHMQQATLAIEDKNFYQHPGFDIPSIMRAVKINISGKRIQGGSTITQQLIKSSMLTSEQSVSRKIKEVILAFWAERIYTKPQILEMYFNQVPYGGMAWGVEAGAETYFDKKVKDLDLAESAFLAGLTTAPTTFSPYGKNPDLWKIRQKEVLKRMVALKFITQKQADKAEAEKLVFKKPITSLHAPHFVEYVKNLLIDKYDIAMVEKGGLQVRTTLDLKLQNKAEKIVFDEVTKEASLNLSNGAALVTDPRTGEILAMVGSKDYFDPNGGAVNIATSLRQPGSSIKVITYAAALEHGFTPASVIVDSPVSYGGYSPVNYDGRFYGPVTLRFALANSLNIPAVKLLNEVGVENMVDLAKRMGIENWGEAEEYGLSLTLGAAEVTMLDMARVNGVLAHQGRLVEVNPILSVTDSKGVVLEKRSSPKPRQVLSEGITYLLSDILADNKARSTAFGPNSALVIPGHFVSVKTGTSDNKRDNWTNGYTDKYVVIVWVGNNDNTPMDPDLASGITGAAPIWNRIMTTLVGKDPDNRPKMPGSVTQKACGSSKEFFLKSNQDC